MVHTLVHDILELPAVEWDALAAQTGLYVSHQWLAAHQDDPTAQVHYALVHDDGHLIAAAPVYVVDTEPNALYRVHDLIPDRTPARTLLAGARRGYLNAPLLHPRLTPDRRRVALNSLVAAVSSLAAAHEAQPWWLYVTDTTAAELADACGTEPVPLGQDAPSRCPVARSRLPRRSAVQAARRHPPRTPGLHRSRIRAAHPTSLRVRGQRRRAARRAPGTPRPRGRSRLHGPAAARPGRGHGRQRNRPRRVRRRPAAFSLFYRHAGTVWLRATGYDYARLRGAYEYFNLVHYLPIEDAYAHGATALHLGMEALRAKTLRGAVTSPLWAIEGAAPDARSR